MTVTMEHKNNRKASWDSKMSISTVSSTTRHYKRSPSSILSSDSDIRFTRKKLSSQYKCGCCIIACFLGLLLLAAASVYVGYTFFASDPPEEQIYRATFKITDGDVFSPELADPSTESFKVRSRDYRERLNLLFRRSPITHGFAGTEVLALDGTEGKDLVIYFNIHVDPSYVSVVAKDLEKILFDEIKAESAYFRNLTIDSSTLEVKESHVFSLPIASSTTVKMISQVVTQKPLPPRVCSQIEISYCSALKYNTTTYPNVLGHKNKAEVEEDMISFRELVDAECYRNAYDFVCQVLQPSCKKSTPEDEMILPCRSFCRDFMMGCGSRLLPKFKDLLSCSKFPEFGDMPTCKAKSGCVEELQSRALSPRICDGIVDCQDLSDEKSCTYCPSDHIHCGIGRTCILSTKRCDGTIDCPDGSDERACLNIAPSISHITSTPIVSPHLLRYYSSGFVIFNEKGEVGKLCTENLNLTLPFNKTNEILQTAAKSLCKTLSYSNFVLVDVEKDDEHNISYVEMKDPTASAISFVRTPCFSKHVLKVACSDLECGLQRTHATEAQQILGKMANHGDWPWHVALFKDDVHVCDATLVSPNWLVTTASCFQGQPKAEWVARFGTVRLTSSSPWQQERRIVGMVKSPVEGSTIAMIKLEKAVNMNDFVRPICLPTEKSGILPNNISQCNTLGWSRNRDQLQRLQIKFTEMEKCENISISTVNSVCTETMYGQDDCNEEEFAGTSVLCVLSDSKKWFLAGVSNWRIACSNAGVDRPRMYDKISSNVDWIQETISAIS
ncbi:hypothetical protein RN001_012046 [Aquatica leii]|uniref:Atrial natriuretic peptide-converting enzyme n=1 Tax=Aquatica leii TaxID=1421715 RepID=A0AAN7SEY4_9COLE|nr:hypothetical protein RN001_012046 [Aquatica leii]